MAEKILVEFKRNGRIVSVTDFRLAPNEEHGLVLDGETSAFPRGFRLSIRPANPVTKKRSRDVWAKNDWTSVRDVRYAISRLGRRLQISGGGKDGDSLPAGRYDIEFRLSGIAAKQSKWRNQRVPDNGALELTCEEEDATQRFDLTTPVGRFDDDTKRIVEASELDDKSIGRWLATSSRHRDRRKACLMNILSKLAVVPSRNGRLNAMVRRVYFCEMDRVYAEVDPEFFPAVKDSFLRKDATVHKTHKRLLATVPGDRRDYKVVSHREDRGRGSLQIVGAVPKDGSAVRFVDIDIDRANPGFNLAQFFIHVGHLLDPRQTNHLSVRKAIQGQTKDFLYYDTVEV